MNNEDILEVVTKLNVELSVQGYTDREVQFSVISDGFTVQVQTLGVTLWNSDNDERAWFEESDEYEPLEDYLRETFAELQDRIFNIDLHT